MRPANNPKTTRKPALNKNNQSWFFHQSGVKLLTLKEIQGGVFAGLLRYTSGTAMYSVMESWFLPFKLQHLRTYLMNPVLSEDEKQDLHPILADIYTDAMKFEKLMEYRIKGIITALEKGAQKSYHSKMRTLTEDRVRASKLTIDYHKDYRPNIFIAKVIEQNHIKPLQYLQRA
jgi:hypothetical protein